MGDKAIVRDGDAAALKRAVSKAGWRILPLLGIGYLVAYMDRVNVSFASTQMNVDLGFSATVYGFGAGLFYLAYSMVEIPSNILLMRFGARRWLARIMIMWGLLAATMLFVRTPLEFYALRFLLGLAEAGFFPGVIFYLSTWFPERQRGKAVGLFYLANPLAVAVMGVISKPLLALNGHADLRGWQWLFLIEGLPAALIGLGVLLWLPEAPEKVPWLAEDERHALTGALAEHPQHNEAHSGHAMLAILSDRRVLLLALIYSLTLSAGTTFILSGPAILMEATGWKLGPVGSLISAGGLVAAALMLIAGYVTDRRGERFTVLFVALAIDALGYLLIAAAPSAGIVAAGVILSQVGRGAHSTAQVALWADVLKDRRLAIGAAAISTVANLCTFALPYAFGAAKDATGTYAFGLWAFPIMHVMAIGAAVALYRATVVKQAARKS
ncbi:MAG: MFS transporter [Sphingomonadales bacterium]|nr:MFS transporter [Sphingomonadales bacterium]